MRVYMGLKCSVHLVILFTLKHWRAREVGNISGDILQEVMRSFSIRVQECIQLTRVYPKVSGLSHNDINDYNNRNNNKHSLRSNTKCYGVKTH